MKAGILYLFLGLSVICACSDDGEQSELHGHFSDFCGKYTGVDIIATNDGQTIKNAELIVGTDGVFTLNNIVNGMETYSFCPEVHMDRETARFTHIDAQPGMEVCITGSLNNPEMRKMTDEVTACIDLRVRIHSDEILGTWTYYSEAVAVQGETAQRRKTAGVLLDTESDSVRWLIPEFTEDDGILPDNIRTDTVKLSEDEVAQILEEMIGLVTYWGVDSLKLTFKENGYIDLRGKVPMQMDTTKMHLNIRDAARYAYHSETGTLVFDAPLPDELVKILGVRVLHIPFSCKFYNDRLEGKLGYAYLQKFIPYIPRGAELDNLLKQLDDIFPQNLTKVLPILKMMITNLVEVFVCKDLVTIDLIGILKPCQNN